MSDNLWNELLFGEVLDQEIIAQLGNVQDRIGTFFQDQSEGQNIIEKDVEEEGGSVNGAS